MNYDFIIYGGGISSEIAVLALAKNNFKVCYVKNQTTKKTGSNLVTFLSSGSINYLYSIIDDPYRQIIPTYNLYESDLKPQHVESIDRSKLLALVKKYLEIRKIMADWEIIKDTPTEQLINYSGILVPFTAEEKQLLLESKTIITRSHVLEALYQAKIY